MASITKTIRSLRKQDLKVVDDILAAAADLPELSAAEEDVVYQYQMLREELLDRQETEVYSIAEIRLAKQMMKRDKVNNKDKRF